MGLVCFGMRVSRTLVCQAPPPLTWLCGETSTSPVEGASALTHGGHFTVVSVAKNSSGEEKLGAAELRTRFRPKQI